MKFKTDWMAHLHKFRKREMDIIFKRCPKSFFNHALELGAGDGFQSRLLIEYTKRLVSTDYTGERLKQIKIPGIGYVICDAEKADAVFKEKEFDLIFASNLFEHLPNPYIALRSSYKLLTDDGVIILVMPNVFWKVCHVLFFYPHFIISLLEKVTTPGKLKELLHRYILRKEITQQNGELQRACYGNNPKLKRIRAFSSRGIFWPLPHGVSDGHLEEFLAFRKKRWCAEFEAAGFQLVRVINGPVASSYGFGFDFLRFILEKFGFSSEYIYILRKKEAVTYKYPFVEFK